MTFTDVAARVAGEVQLPPDDPRVIAATDAAITLATAYVFGTTPTVTPYALDLDDPAISAGLVALGVTVFLGPRSPSGTVGSDVFTGDIVPGDPLAEVHHYFDHARDARNAFGIG